MRTPGGKADIVRLTDRLFALLGAMWIVRETLFGRIGGLLTARHPHSQVRHDPMPILAVFSYFFYAVGVVLCVGLWRGRTWAFMWLVTIAAIELMGLALVASKYDWYARIVWPFAIWVFLLFYALFRLVGMRRSDSAAATDAKP